MSGIPNTIIIESNRQIAYKEEIKARAESSTLRSEDLPDFPNNKWRTHLEFGQDIKQGDEISLEAAMINDIGGGDEVMEFIGRTGITNRAGVDIDDSRARLSLAFYVNNRYQFNFIHPKSTYICARYHLAIDYGGPNLDGAGAGTGAADPTQLQQFATFRDCYPYQAIEGFSHNQKVARVFTAIPAADFPTFSKPNNKCFNPSDQKFYIGPEDFTGPYFNPAEGDDDQTQEWQPFTSDVDLEVPYGFSTPAAVAERLTSQLHQRDGVASNWQVNNVTPLIFKIDSDGVILDQAMPGISDKTYQTFPSSTGQLFYARLFNGAGGLKGWGCAFEGEKSSTGTAVPVGTNYQANQGRVQFWKHTLCENIAEWQGHTLWSRLQREPFVMTDITSPLDLNNKSLYTGPTQIEQFTHNGKTYNIGELGVTGSVLLDQTRTKQGQFFYTNSLTKDAIAPLINNPHTALWDIRVQDLIPINMTLNFNNLGIAQESFKAAKYIISGTGNSSPTSMAYKSAFAVNFVCGRIDDEATLSSANRLIYLPCPLMIAAKNPAREPYTTFSGTGSPPAYAGTGQGKSYTIDMDAPVYSNLSQNAPQPRLYGGSRESSTRYEVPIFCYGDPAFNAKAAQANTLTNSFGSRVGENLFPDNQNSLFQTAIPNGNLKTLQGYYDLISQSADGMGLGIVPVFYKETFATGINDKLLNVPFMAMLVRSANGLVIPAPCPGEFFGLGSPTLTQNNLGKIVTTQKVSNSGYGQAANLTPENYMPYIYAGASDSLINFDGGYSRFTISQLHTAVKPGNGVFQNINQSESGQPEQDSMTAYETQAALCTIDGGGDPVSYRDQIAIPRPQPIISAQAGVAFFKLFSFLNTGKPISESQAVINSPFNLQQYSNTLFNKLGFSFEQIMPEYGLPDNEFNRGNYNRYLGQTNIDLLDKQQNMVKPFTTNAFISAAAIISMVQGIAVKDSDAPSTAAEGPVPAANLGGLIDSQSTTNADSDLLIATSMPQKLDYPYLVVYTDIVRNPLYYGGPDGSQKLSAIAYITRNYAEGDFFYSFATGWSYTADQDYIITDITTDIRLPDGSPAPIDKNSSVIYKIATTKAMPPPPQVLGQALIAQAKLDEKMNKNKKK